VAGKINFNGGTLHINAGGSSPEWTSAQVDSLLANATQNSGVFSIDTTGGDVTITSALTGDLGLTKLGANTLTVTAGSYTGATFIGAGTVKLAADDALSIVTDLTLGSGTNAASFNLNDFNQTVASLSISSNTTNENVVTISGGKTLTVNGSATGTIFSVGVVPAADGQTTRATFTGGGSLVVDNPSATIEIGRSNTSQGNPTNNTTLDLSGLSLFNANAETFRVSFGSRNSTTLTLSNTRNVITAGTFSLADSNMNNAGPGTVILGSGSNVIQANLIEIGFSKANGILKFASQTAGSLGTVTITDTAGTGGANIIVASNLDTGTSSAPVSSLDFRGHIANVTADTLTIARLGQSSVGSQTGTVYFDGGTFTANQVNIAPKSNTGSGTATGTLNISGGVFTVNPGGSFTVATRSGTNGSANGILNLTGGSLISNADLLHGGGTNATATLTLDGGILDMLGHAIGDATNPFDNLNFRSGTLQNVSEINGGAALTKTTTGTLFLAGTNSYSGGTSITAGTLIARTAGAMGTGDVTVASGTGFQYAASADAPLSLAGNLTVTGGSGTTIGGSIGSTPTSAQVNVAGIAGTDSAPVSVNIYGIPGISPAAGTNLYTLIEGGAGSSLNNATYSLGTVYNNTNFTVGALSSTATNVQIGITNATPLTTAFWKGGLSGAENVWAASNGSTTSNWTTTAGGAVQALVPSGGTDVTISATSPTTVPTATVLGADMSIQSLTIADAVNVFKLNADGHVLTIGTGGVTMNTNVQNATISADVALNGNQIWNPANKILTLNGTVSGSSALTINSSSTTGNVVLSGANTYSGGTTLAGKGLITLSHSSALGTGVLNLQSTVTGPNYTLLLSGGIAVANPVNLTMTTGREGIGSSGGDNTLSGLMTMTGTTGNALILATNTSGKTFAISGGISAPVGYTGTISLRGTTGGQGLFSDNPINAPGATIDFNGGSVPEWTFATSGNSWFQTTFNSTGILHLGIDNALPSSARMNWGTAAGGIFDLNGYNQSVAGLNISSTSSTPNVTNRSTTSDSRLTLAGLTANLTYVGTITDGDPNTRLSLVMDSEGRSQTLSGTPANTYSGTTTVSAGTLILNRTAEDNATIVTDGEEATDDIIINGGTLQLLQSEQIGNTGRIVLNSGALNFGAAPGKTETIGSFTNNGGDFTTGSNTLAGSGEATTFAGGTNTVSNGGVVRSNHLLISGGTNTVSGGSTGGLIQVDSGGAGLEMSDGGILTLNSDNGTAGRLLLKGNASSSGDSTVRISSGLTLTNTGTIDLDGGTRTFDVADGTAGSDFEISAVITNGALTKTGGGTLTLTATNSYSGDTTITEGTLALQSSSSNNPIANSATLFVGDGATLDVTGISTGGGFVVSSGQTLSGGSSSTAGNVTGITTIQSGGVLTGGTAGTVGTLSFSGDLNVDAGSTWLVDLVSGSGINDQINIGGILTLGGALSISDSGLFANDNSMYTIATYSSRSGFFSNAADGESITLGGGTWRVDYGSGAITLTAVPEPGTYLILAFLLGGIVWMRRIRNRQGEANPA
jgi:autotransporter-associated beta strand protein